MRLLLLFFWLLWLQVIIGGITSNVVVKCLGGALFIDAILSVLVSVYLLCERRVLAFACRGSLC